MAKHELWELKQIQSLPLQAKIQMTRTRIRAWIEEFGEDGVYVSFSGGKDSTVLLDIVRKDYPNVQAVFVNTGLEYPSVRLFAESKENVVTLRPSMNFRDVICKYGYPVIGKQQSKKCSEARKGSRIALKNFNGEMKGSLYDYSRYSFLLEAPFNVSEKCCDEMKKKPLKGIHKKPIIGSMAEESKNRLKSWLQNGCNAFESNNPKSNPMSFWTEQDVLAYIQTNNLPIAEAYGEVVVKNDGIDGQINIHDLLGDYRDCQYETTGCKRTGCIFCMFGVTQDKERFIRLSEQEPKLCDYVMRGGEFGGNGMWQPSKDGLGYWFVLDWLALNGLNIPYNGEEEYRKKYGNEKTEEILNTEKKVKNGGIIDGQNKNRLV